MKKNYVAVLVVLLVTMSVTVNAQKKGAVRIIYEDGKEEVFAEGEAFFMRPGHTAVVEKDLQLVSFSPEHEMHELSDHLEKKVAEMQKASEYR